MAKHQKPAPATPAASTAQPATAETPPAQPAAAAAPVTPAAEETKKLTFGVLEALKPDEIAGYGKQMVQADKRITKAKDAFSESVQFYAVVVAAMKRHYVAGLNSGYVIPDVTFPKYLEQHCGGRAPGRVMTLSALFNSTVLNTPTPLLTEENFMAAAVDVLETANGIIARAIKKHGDNWKGCDDVLDTLNALSKPGEPRKTLKEIAARQKGDKKDDTAEAAGTSVTLTVGRAVEFLKAAIKDAGKMPETQASSLMMEIVLLSGMWTENECGVKQETLDRWNDNMLDGRAPHVDAAKPAAPTTPEPAPIKSLRDIPAPVETPELVEA